MRPSVAITTGDPAGIGPEIVARLLSDPAVRERARFTVIGDIDVMKAAASVAGVPGELFASSGGAVAVVTPPDARIGTPRWGVLDAEHGRHAARCMEYALDPALRFDALVCAPMNKEAFHLAGYAHPDELAFMAEVTGSDATATLGFVNGLWTSSLSEHIPFSEIRACVKADRILGRIEVLQAVLVSAGCKKPRIAVAALNPHAGEGGQLGREEIDEIAPAIAAAVKEGIGAVGPIPADMVFVLGSAGSYDGILAMYHDQANIARKLLGRGCTVYHGLPIPATTTAHGTAFDIAGTGTADAESMRQALELAVRMASS